MAGLLRWDMVFFRVVEEGLTIVEMSLFLCLLTSFLRDALSQVAGFVMRELASSGRVVLRRQLITALTCDLWYLVD